MLISCAMLTCCALSIGFHIILVIVLMTIQVFYISIIFYKLLPIFMIHVSFINIVLSLFTCSMPEYSKEVDTGKNCMYPRVLSLYETVISIYVLLYDPNEVHVINPNMASIHITYVTTPTRHTVSSEGVIFFFIN